MIDVQPGKFLTQFLDCRYESRLDILVFIEPFNGLTDELEINTLIFLRIHKQKGLQRRFFGRFMSKIVNQFSIQRPQT